MKTHIVEFVILCIFPAGCSPTDLGDEYLTLRSPVASAAVTSQSASEVSFLAKASWHNGCGRFARAEVTQNGFSILITVFGRQPKDANCTQAFIEFDAPVTFKVPSAGTYTFKFWRTDSTSYDITCTIR